MNELDNVKLEARGIHQPNVTFWAIMFGAIGAAIASSKVKSFHFTYVNGEIIQTEINKQGELVGQSMSNNKGNVKSIIFVPKKHYGKLTIVPIKGKKENYNISLPYSDMQKMVDLFNAQ